MADASKLVPFIKTAEGGYVNDPNDKGQETNKGVTITVWESIFGTEHHDRFISMSDSDWLIIFKPNYWDKALGDKIASQRVANMIVDWIWLAGRYYPELEVQQLLDSHFSAHITTDGVFGQHTIDAINSAPESEIYAQICQLRRDYVTAIAMKDQTQERFLKGWLNRIDNLIKFNV